MAVGWGIKVRHITSKGLRYRWYRWLGKNGCEVGGLFSTPWPCTCPILDWTRTHNQDQSHGIPQRIIQIEIVTSVDEPATGARCIAACSGIQPYSRESEDVMRACAPGPLRCDPIIISAKVSTAGLTNCKALPGYERIERPWSRLHPKMWSPNIRKEFEI
jgi:hypothetical protein